MFTAQILYQFLLFSGVSSCVVTFSLGLNLARATYDSSGCKSLGMCSRFCRCSSLTTHPTTPEPSATHHMWVFAGGVGRKWQHLPNAKFSCLIRDFKNKSIFWAGWWVENKIKLVFFFNDFRETQVHFLVNTHPCSQEFQVRNSLLWNSCYLQHQALAMAKLIPGGTPLPPLM